MAKVEFRLRSRKIRCHGSRDRRARCKHSRVRSAVIYNWLFRGGCHLKLTRFALRGVTCTGVGGVTTTCAAGLAGKVDVESLWM